MPDGKFWTQYDRFGNEIYLTHERWTHIIDPDNHPEVEPFPDQVAETIRSGRRHQDGTGVVQWDRPQRFPKQPARREIVSPKALFAGEIALKTSAV